MLSVPCCVQALPRWNGSDRTILFIGWVCIFLSTLGLQAWLQQMVGMAVRVRVRVGMVVRVRERVGMVVRVRERVGMVVRVKERRMG